MIPLLPYKRLVFESPLCREELIRRLMVEVAGRSWSWGLFERRTEKFEGVVFESGFKINRIIRGRNSFLPVIVGKFYPLVKGVRVEVRMRLHLAVLIFSVLWLSFIGVAAVGSVLQIYSTRRFESGILIVFGMLLFFYLLVTLSFGLEANKAGKLLADIFEADGRSGPVD